MTKTRAKMSILKGSKKQIITSGLKDGTKHRIGICPKASKTKDSLQ